MQEVLNWLEKHEIDYQLFRHKAVFTSAESGQLDIPEVSGSAKNLFLKNDNHSRYFLLTVPHGSRTDLKAFAKHLGEKRLSFGSVEELKDLLGLTPGSVSPFGLLNDHAGRVEFWLDQQLALAQKISVHPNNNTATITLSLKDFQKAIDQTSHSVKIWDY